MMTWEEIDRWESEQILSPERAIEILSGLAADPRWWYGVVIQIIASEGIHRYHIGLWDNVKNPSIFISASSLSLDVQRAILKCFWNEDGSRYNGS